MGKLTGPLVIIDGHNMFIRNYVRSPYTDSNGQRMGGTTGMIISVRKVINDLQPSNVLVVWDGEGGSQKRRSIFSEYKAGRTVRLNENEGEDFGETAEQKLENMRHQRNMAQEYLTLLGIPQVRPDAVEADDVMAYVAGKMDHPGGCIIVTTDQDLLQMVREDHYEHAEECLHGQLCNSDDPKFCPNAQGLPICGGTSHSEVRVWSPIKKKMYDRKTFISEYGVLPENFRLVKAISGDPSDNIDGIKGFGPKTVAKCFPFLLDRRASAEDVLTAAGSIKGVLGKRLVEEKSKMLGNLALVDLSEPMLSATAARQARDALVKDIGCKEVDFRIRIARDSVSFGDTNLVGPFRELVARRRRLLAETKVAAVAEENQDG